MTVGSCWWFSVVHRVPPLFACLAFYCSWCLLKSKHQPPPHTHTHIVHILSPQPTLQILDVCVLIHASVFLAGSHRHEARHACESKPPRCLPDCVLPLSLSLSLFLSLSLTHSHTHRNTHTEKHTETHAVLFRSLTHKHNLSLFVSSLHTHTQNTHTILFSHTHTGHKPSLSLQLTYTHAALTHTHQVQP